MTQSLVQKNGTISNFLSTPAIKSKIAEMVGGDKSQGFITSLIASVSMNPSLSACDPSTLLSAALQGEALKLSPSPMLGHFYMVGYEDRKNNRTVAQFQIGWKGIMQLAIRSGQYRTINVISLKRGELKKYNPMTEEIEVELIEDEEKREAEETVGYYAALEYLNGFRKSIYWSAAKMKLHAKKYSKGYASDLSKGNSYTFWSKNFDEMAMKTMLRQLLTKWGLLSIEIQSAIESDQAVINDGVVRHIDTEDILPSSDVETMSSEVF